MNSDVCELNAQDIATMRQCGVLSESCPISPARLRIVNVKHLNFKGDILKGQIMVLDAVSQYVATIFNDLYNIKFPIAQISLMSHYSGDDEKSMAANNTSAFNDRVIAGSSKISMHAYGLAIDINPVQNPCLFPDPLTGAVKVVPSCGEDFINRSLPGEGFVEAVIPIFAQNGFNVWGGDWNSPIDYHHFQVSRPMAEQLVTLSPSEATAYFNKFCNLSIK